MGWLALKRITGQGCLVRLLAPGVCLLVASGSGAKPNASQETSALPLVQQGENLLRSHDAQQAKQVLEQSVKVEPENAKAWGLLADAFSQLGLEQDAIRAYEKTLTLRPDDSLALYNLGSLRLRQGRFEEAARCLQSFHKLQPQDKSVLLPLAHCLLSLGRSTEAQATVKELLKASDIDPEVNLQAGKLLLAHGEVQAALKPLGDALQLQAGSDEARLMLAMAESQLGRPARVIELLEGHPQRESPLYASLLGSALCDKKDYERAVPLLEEAIRQHTEEKLAYLQLAAAYAALSKGREAVQTLRQAHVRWPGNVEIRLTLARQLFTARDPVEALVVLREVPESALSTEELGMLVQGYAAIDRLEEARRYGELAAHREDVPERTVIALANVYQLEARDLDAIALLEKHRQFAGSAKYLFTLAFSYYNRGNYSASNELLSDVIVRDPKLAQAFYLKGSCLSSLGKPDEALLQYETATRLVPNNSLYHFQLGLVLSMLRQKDRAEAELKKSLDLNDLHAPAHYELAKIYFDSSRDGLARQQLEDAIKADPDFSSSFYLLSQVYMRMGRSAEANAMMKQFQQMQQKQRDKERTMKEGAMKERAVSGPKP